MDDFSQLKHLSFVDRGGFGKVDLVQNRAGKTFAKKTFAADTISNAQLLENVKRRFEKEVRIQGGVKHQNIVPILHEALSEVPPYYIMPVAESSLAGDLEKDRSLGGNFVSALSDIVAGLEELHSMQIFHRDLKPGNVLRLKDLASGKDFYAISDFGLISMHESSLSALTRTGMRKTSDHYTAPEITKDLRNASVQSDVYSLGCILHDMVGTEERVPCGEIREPGDFSAILLGCTRKEPSQRFKSAKAVLDAILSVQFTPTTSPGFAAADLVNTLDGTTIPTTAYWEKLAEFLESDPDFNDLRAIYSKLNNEWIAKLCNQSPSHANRIGSAFAQWVENNTFNFDFCDPLANRLEEFYNNTKFETKVECLMALIYMGTSHNRWYVERKFVDLCGSSMDENLAKRFAIQFRIAGEDMCVLVNRLEHSINFDRNDFHPLLVQALSEICQ